MLSLSYNFQLKCIFNIKINSVSILVINANINTKHNNNYEIVQNANNNTKIMIYKTKTTIFPLLT